MHGKQRDRKRGENGNEDNRITRDSERGREREGARERGMERQNCASSLLNRQIAVRN